MRLLLCVLATCCLALPKAGAVEIIGEPPAYLSLRMKPSWRLVPLAGAFDDLARLTKVEVQRSEQAQKIDQLLVLISNQELTLHAVLLQLEGCTEARFSVTGTSLRVEHRSEFDQRRREVRWYPLSEYGLLTPVVDAPPITLGIDPGPPIGDHHDGATPTAEETPATQTFGREELVEFIRNNVASLSDSWETEGIGIEARGPGPILDFKETPEIHAFIRDILADVRQRLGQPQRWQVTMGLLAKETHIPTGIVLKAVAQEVTPKLTGTTILNLSGLPGQLVQAAKLAEQSHLVTADVVDGRFDPGPAVVLAGRSATVRALDGQQGIFAYFALAWVEEAEASQVGAIRSPAHESPATTTTRTVDGAQGTPVATTAAAATGGVHIPLASPVLWTWRPDFECLLPTGHALVLSSEHPRGQAVMVVEALP